MDKIDFFLSAVGRTGLERRHYADHMAPVWLALPDEVRGDFMCVENMADYVRGLGIEPKVYINAHHMVQALRLSKRLTVVCGHRDPAWTDRYHRPNILMYHGVGFVFEKHGRINPSYPVTKENRQNTKLILAPGKEIAEIEQEANPHLKVVAIGCPKLDKWHSMEHVQSDPPVIALAWHWDCKVVRETRPAFEEFEYSLPALKDHYQVLGHGHPHIIDQLAPKYERMGIEVVRNLDEVFARADLMVCDASSAMFEWATLDRPIVVAQSSQYKSAGGMFEQRQKLGVVCDDPTKLKECIDYALTDPEKIKRSRRAVVKRAYAYTDGKCAERAAEEILKILEELHAE